MITFRYLTITTHNFLHFKKKIFYCCSFPSSTHSLLRVVFGCRIKKRKEKITLWWSLLYCEVRRLKEKYKRKWLERIQKKIYLILLLYYSMKIDGRTWETFDETNCSLFLYTWKYFCIRIKIWKKNKKNSLKKIT